MRILYCGMQNYGGPGKIGKELKNICNEMNYEFYWFHNSKHEKSSFVEDTNIILENLLLMKFDIIFYNQWRNITIYKHFLGISKQILFVMYEQIPLYWKDFYYSSKNKLLSSSFAINSFLDIDAPIINWAVPLTRQANYYRNEIPIFFFPARDGGENDRKGIFVLDKALKILHSNFTVNLVISQDKVHFYKEKSKYLFKDKRINIIDCELSEEEYYSVFSKSNALLCPSMTSGIELSLRDAILLEKEVIVTDIAPMNELFNKTNAWMITGKSIQTEFENNILPVPIFQADYISLADTINSFIDAYREREERKINHIASSKLYHKFKKQLIKELSL